MSDAPVRPARTAALSPSEAAAEPRDDEVVRALDMPDEGVEQALRRAQAAVSELCDSFYGAFRLSATQLAVLALIDTHPGRRQSAIGEALGVKRPNFTLLLDELERRGLAMRERSPLDRRSHALHLTAAGRDVLANAQAARTALEQHIADALGADRRADLLTLLRALCERL